MGPLLLAVFLLQLLSAGLGFPSGAPASACMDMMPKHAGVQPQPTRAPYLVETSSSTFLPGQPLKVTIKGPDYRGVLLEARTGSNMEALGTWTSPPTDTKFLQCSGKPQGAITHANTNVKGNSTVYTWTPPSGLNNVYFMATVAQQRTVYWLNVRSATLNTGAPGGVNLASGAGSMMWNRGIQLLTPSLCLMVLFF